ncbi:MAG: GGDEF domain-containing protein [Actinomycetota bacterium]|nr:GGDEF domain-containing protein [Actinomycetota bacterium]
MVAFDVAVVVALVCVAKAWSDQAHTAAGRWLLFVASAGVLVLVCAAVPLRVLLRRREHGLRAQAQRARRQAETDALTGLLNRRSIESVARELHRGEHPFAVAICDLDHFKVLNDTHGHDAGDRALREFAAALRSVVRTGDFVARHGGEEFVLILAGSTKRNACDVLSRVRLELAGRLGGGEIPWFTFSAGVADNEEAGEWKPLLRLADQRLLAAKREGRDRVLAATA